MRPDDMRGLADIEPDKQFDTPYVNGLRAALRDAADRLDAVQKAAVDALPPYNFELNPDGSENPLSAAYAEGVKEVYLPVMNALTAILTTPTDQEASK